jgi:hypothetical protein
MIKNPLLILISKIKNNRPLTIIHEKNIRLILNIFMLFFKMFIILYALKVVILWILYKAKSTFYVRVHSTDLKPNS